jgi:hypothetical protein
VTRTGQRWRSVARFPNCSASLSEPDELGLCRTCSCRRRCTDPVPAAEDAWLRAAGYARRVNDRRQLTEILGWLASAALWGPTPATVGIRQCEDYLDEIGNHPTGQAVVLRHMAGLYAMQDSVATANATLKRAKALWLPPARR